MLSTCRVRVPAGCPLHAPEAPEAQGSRPRGRARVDTCAARVPTPSVPAPRAAQPGSPRRRGVHALCTPHPHRTRSSAQARRTGVRARPTSPCCSRARTGGRTTCPRLCWRAARPEALGPTSPPSPATPRQRRSERRAAPSLGRPRRWLARDSTLPRADRLECSLAGLTPLDIWIVSAH